MAFADIGAFTTGDILTAADLTQIRANFLALGTQPACSIRSSVTQDVTTGATGEVLLADTENYDSDTMHTGSQARQTIQTGGLWLAMATVQFAFHATGNRGASFRLDGTTNYESMFVPASGATNSTVLTIVRPFVLTAAQYVEIRAVHSQGSDNAVTLQDFSMIHLNY
jgi:hypothetical protein